MDVSYSQVFSEPTDFRVDSLTVGSKFLLALLVLQQFTFTYFS